MFRMTASTIKKKKLGSGARVRRRTGVLLRLKKEGHEEFIVGLGIWDSLLSIFFLHARRVIFDSVFIWGKKDITGLQLQDDDLLSICMISCVPDKNLMEDVGATELWGY